MAAIDGQRRIVGRERPQVLGIRQTLFSEAVEQELIDINPFAKLVSGSVGNQERQQFVSLAETQRLIDVCTDSELRLIVALSRYGGLRCPSEHLGLKWADIDWDCGSMTVTSPKTSKQGKPKRFVPIFEGLKPYLMECWELAESGAEHVITRPAYRSLNGAYIRKRLSDLVERAGLKRWPRITHNLRSSRQTELERDNPTHIVCAIMGNTPAVAHRHYLQTSLDDILKAAANENQGQQPAVWGRNEPHQRNRDSGGVTAKVAQTPEKQGDAKDCEPLRDKLDSGSIQPAGVDGNRTHPATFQPLQRV